MKPVQKSLFFRYFRKLSHGQRTTFIKGPIQNSKKNTILVCIQRHLTVQCTHCALGWAEKYQVSQKDLIIARLFSYIISIIIISTSLVIITGKSAISHFGYYAPCDLADPTRCLTIVTWQLFKSSSSHGFVVLVKVGVLVLVRLKVINSLTPTICLTIRIFICISIIITRQKR